jgi:hypothetical protein
MDYSSLLQKVSHPGDISDPNSQRTTAPGPRHAVHVADGRVVCGYTRQPTDEREPDVDWMTAVHPGQRCNMCARELGVEGYLDPDDPLGMPS